VQIVEIADPATAGRFAGDLAVMPVDRHPAIAAGTRQGEIDFVRRPFRLARAALADFPVLNVHVW
jgi:hypothetical protein